jgi:hypothetical protein
MNSDNKINNSQKKTLLTPQAQLFYTDVLKELVKSKIPFMVGGTFAFSYYTKIIRDTKDIDLFCKAGDYPRLLKVLTDRGFKPEVTDERWIVKAIYKDHFADLIFGSKSGVTAVDDTWFKKAPTGTILGSRVKIIPPVELIWSKSLRMEKTHYDGADVNHLLLVLGPKLDWKLLMTRMEAQWEVLLSHILLFRFVYPSERNMIPEWVMNELLSRLQHQMALPPAIDKISRGYILSHDQYEIDIEKWGYKNIT